MPTDISSTQPACVSAVREDDDIYFQRRSVDELKMAQNATLPEAAAAHAALADAYHERVASTPPSTDDAASGRGDRGDG